MTLTSFSAKQIHDIAPLGSSRKPRNMLPNAGKRFPRSAAKRSQGQGFAIGIVRRYGASVVSSRLPRIPGFPH
jgi:hypothetical protein